MTRHHSTPMQHYARQYKTYNTTQYIKTQYDCQSITLQLKYNTIPHKTMHSNTITFTCLSVKTKKQWFTRAWYEFIASEYEVTYGYRIIAFITQLSIGIYQHPSTYCSTYQAITTYTIIIALYNTCIIICQHIAVYRKTYQHKSTYLIAIISIYIYGCIIILLHTPKYIMIYHHVSANLSICHDQNIQDISLYAANLVAVYTMHFCEALLRITIVRQFCMAHIDIHILAMCWADIHLFFNDLIYNVIYVGTTRRKTFFARKREKIIT